MKKSFRNEAISVKNVTTRINGFFFLPELAWHLLKRLQHNSMQDKEHKDLDIENGLDDKAPLLKKQLTMRLPKRISDLQNKFL